MSLAKSWVLGQLLLLVKLSSQFTGPRLGLQRKRCRLWKKQKQKQTNKGHRCGQLSLILWEKFDKNITQGPGWTDKLTSSGKND